MLSLIRRLYSTYSRLHRLKVVGFCAIAVLANNGRLAAQRATPSSFTPVREQRAVPDHVQRELPDAVTLSLSDTASARHGTSVLEGAVLGFTVGAMIGGVIAATTHQDRAGGYSRGAAVTVGVMAYGSLGAGVGAALAAISRNKKRE